MRTFMTDRLFFVELFDEAALVQLFDETGVDKFFRLVLVDFRARRRDVFIARFHSLDVRIGRGEAMFGEKLPRLLR